MTITRAEALSLIRDFDKNEQIIMTALDTNGNSEIDYSEVGPALVKRGDESDIDQAAFRKMVKLDPKIEKFYYLRSNINPSITGDYCVYLDLRGVDLSGENLEGVRLAFSSQPAVSVDLSGANLDNALLSNASLMGAFLDGISLNGARCNGAKFWSAHFRDAFAINADFEHADFCGADIRGMKAKGANFEGASFLSAAVDDSWICPPK